MARAVFLIPPARADKELQTSISVQRTKLRSRHFARKKARYERFVSFAGPQTEGIAKNYCPKGHLAGLREYRSAPHGYALYCSTCTEFLPIE